MGLINVKAEGEFKDGPTSPFLLPVSFLMIDNEIVGVVLIVNDDDARTLVGERRGDAYEVWIRSDKR
jgi:hypothetical protein